MRGAGPGSALLFLLLGLAGWRLAERIRLPAPAMIGSMALVAAAAALGLPGPGLPPWLRLLAQAAIGGSIGRRVDRRALGQAARALPGIALSSAWYLGSGVGIGLLVAAWAGLELKTALLATAPAGVVEMTAFAVAAGADSVLVATMQALRILAINTAIPFLVRRRTRAAASLPAPRPSTLPEEGASPVPPASEAGPGAPRLHWLLGLACGIGGSLLFARLGVPAGAVVGAMVASAALRLLGLGLEPAPKLLLSSAYLVLGISVGLSFTAETLALLGSSLGAILLGTLATLLSGLLLALLVRRLMRLELATALLACSPAGLSLMAVVAEETGAETLVVSLFQLVRVVWIVLAMPVLLRLLG